MNVALTFIDDFEYSVKQKSFPFIIELSSEEKIELAEKIDVTEINLQNKKNKELEFGFDRLIFGIPQKSFFLNKGNVKKIEKDIFEKEDPEGFISGFYTLKVVVVVYIKLNKNYTPKEFTIEKEVYVQP